MSRYLVTGAAGFIGRRLSEYLSSQGHEIWALLRQPTDGPWSHAFCCELGNQPLPHGLMKGVDGIFHLANVAHTDLAGREAERYWQVNVTGTKSLLNAAADAGVSRFVYFSSVKAVADPGDDCVGELWDRMPEDDYGRSKREAERLVLAKGEEQGMHVCNLRPALVYGEGVKGNLSLMLQAVKQRRFPPLPEFDNRRSMVALHDLISAAWLAIGSPKANGQTYIVTDGVGYSTRGLYEAMCEELGVPVSSWCLPKGVLRVGAIVGDGLGWLIKREMPLNSKILKRLAGSVCYQSERIQNDLGWQPKQAFSDVLPDMVKSIRTQ